MQLSKSYWLPTNYTCYWHQYAQAVEPLMHSPHRVIAGGRGLTFAVTDAILNGFEVVGVAPTAAVEEHLARADLGIEEEAHHERLAGSDVPRQQAHFLCRTDWIGRVSVWYRNGGTLPL